MPKLAIMNHGVLLIALILIGLAVIVGAYQRIVEMPKWFANPPASFDLIRKQSKNARIFWILLTALFMIFICTVCRISLTVVHLCAALFVSIAYNHL